MPTPFMPTEETQTPKTGRTFEQAKATNPEFANVDIFKITKRPPAKYSEESPEPTATQPATQQTKPQGQPTQPKVPQERVANLM